MAVNQRKTEMLRRGMVNLCEDAPVSAEPRMDKVAALREAIARGEYAVSAEDLAERLLRVWCDRSGQTH
jgi:anti-sigma28 factor (negative regulator of flagellin synthesis)